VVRHLEAGEGGTEAEAWASAKREVPSGAAGQVQLLRHGELERVAVGLLNVHQDRSAGGDALTAEQMVSYGGPAATRRVAAPRSQLTDTTKPRWRAR
jgi:hypothetical protein